MKKIILLLLFFGFSYSAFSQITPKEQKIRQYLEMTGGAKIGVLVFNNLISTFKKSYNQANNQFWDDLAKEIKPEDFVNMVVPLYNKYYTEEDIDQLLIFYNSPVGKKVIEVLPSITQEAMTAGKEWGEKLMEKIINKLEEKGYKKS